MIAMVNPIPYNSNTFKDTLLAPEKLAIRGISQSKPDLGYIPLQYCSIVAHCRLITTIFIWEELLPQECITKLITFTLCS